MELSLFFFGLACFLLAIWIVSDEIKKKESRRLKALRDTIVATSSTDYIRGRNILRRIKWVRVADAKDTIEFRRNLKVLAAAAGGNAIINITFRYTKDKGELSYHGEGMVVVVDGDTAPELDNDNHDDEIPF